ncbi:MAG: hypothetical protein NWF14_09545, partial [Candidatus Bathyarchaeota archaeon]|nr:hypothetical protein [Candidatus Bathyarchaeota archaeon]
DVAPFTTRIEIFGNSHSYLRLPSEDLLSKKERACIYRYACLLEEGAPSETQKRRVNENDL